MPVMIQVPLLSGLPGAFQSFATVTNLLLYYKVYGYTGGYEGRFYVLSGVSRDISWPSFLEPQSFTRCNPQAAGYLLTGTYCKLDMA